jgi:hypothetical protein
MNTGSSALPWALSSLVLVWENPHTHCQSNLGFGCRFPGCTMENAGLNTTWYCRLTCPDFKFSTRDTVGMIRGSAKVNANLALLGPLVKDLLGTLECIFKNIDWAEYGLPKLGISIYLGPCKHLEGSCLV